YCAKICMWVRFKVVRVFNDSLIIKQVWRLLTKPNSLMTRVLKEKYFPSTCVLDARKTSSAWNSLVKVLSFYKQGFRREINDGLNTKILTDPWVPGLRSGIPSLLSNNMNFQITWVQELLMDNGRSWNRELIQSIFTLESTIAILEMRGLDPTNKDRWIWWEDSKGTFSLASTYSAAILKLSSSEHYWLGSKLLKLFPNMLPSTFQDKMKEQVKCRSIKRRLHAKIEYANFLQETVKEMAKEVQNSRSGETKKTAEDLDEFLNKVRSGARVANEEILGFAKLFDYELTVDNISRPRLVNTCKYMGISSIGTDAYLRYMLRKRLQRIKNDDKLIQAEGVESRSEAELREDCRERGMLGVLSVDEMHQQ
ncbi:LETM1-like protein, partial [Striga hermonthica]